MKEPAQTTEQLKRKIYALENRLEKLLEDFENGRFSGMILLHAALGIKILRLKNYIKKLKSDLDKTDQLSLFI